MIRKVEMHMPSDRPGMMMRRRLMELLEAHGEKEVSHAQKSYVIPGPIGTDLHALTR